MLTDDNDCERPVPDSHPVHLSCITQKEKISELHGYINCRVHITMLLCRAACFTLKKKTNLNYWYQILTTHDALVWVSFFFSKKKKKTYIVNHLYQSLSTHDALVAVTNSVRYFTFLHEMYMHSKFMLHSCLYITFK